MHKKNIFFVGIAALSMAVSTVAAVVATQHIDPEYNLAGNQVEGTIVFTNTGSNVTETPSGVEGFFNQRVRSYLHDGSAIDMVAIGAKSIDKFANNPLTIFYNNEIRFEDAEEHEFHFQTIKNVYIRVDLERDLHIKTSIDGTSFTDNYCVSEDDGTYSGVFSGHYLRLGYYSEMDVPVYEIRIDYSCSYDYVDQTKKITIYSTNDFHGAIKANGYQMGLEKMGTYLKQKSAEENTLLLDQGDSWQGSIYSNDNKGALVNDAMIEIGYDARTVGNHDFDWGIQALKNNTARVYKGKTLTTLAANVYDYNYDLKQFGTTQQSDIGQKSATFTLENGLKVGVVGVVGSDQITSIATPLVKTIGFKNHIDVIKSEATKLRNEDNCDVVIASCHCDEKDVRNNGLENYVDLVLCAHSHDYEISAQNGLSYAQFEANGTKIGKINLYYDAGLGKVTASSIEFADVYSVNNAITEIDPTIHSLVQTYENNCSIDPNTVVANNVNALPDGDPFFVANDVVMDIGTNLHYYVYNGSTWSHGGQIIQPEDLGGYYYWYSKNDPESPEEGNYYINTTTGVYSKCVGGLLQKIGDLIPGSAPSHVYGMDSRIKQGETLENMMAKAIYDTAVAAGYDDIICSYVNVARVNMITPDPLTHDITYADIYSAFPFDNDVYIIEVTGREIMNEIYKYNYACFSDDFTTAGKPVDLYATYKIAVLDYIAFHNDSDRAYDWFDQNAGAFVGKLSGTYRPILVDWLDHNNYNSGELLDTDSFNKDYVDNYDRSDLHVTNTFDLSFEMNDGTYTMYEVVQDVAYNEYVNNHLPATDPVRAGYTFAGWYRNRAGTNSIGSLRVTENRTFYAKWEEENPNIYETANLDYLVFEADTEQTIASASNGTDSVNITFTHSPIIDNSGYKEFNLPNNGFLALTAPTGYKITYIEIKQYSTHPENLTFYSGTAAVYENMLADNYENGDKCSIHKVTTNVDSIYVQETNDDYTTALYYVFVRLEKTA